MMTESIPPQAMQADSTVWAEVPEPSEAVLRRMLETMILVRAFDERALKLQRSGRISFCVTSIGEEAANIGTAAALAPQDWVFPSYRQHGLALYRGVSLARLADQLFGNAADTVKGRQMPCHYSAHDHRFVSISSVIGTQIIQGVGAAMAAKIRKDDAVTLTYFGDGATSANDFHSGMNFAGVYQAPVVFVCINNQYAISLPVRRQTASPSIACKAQAYGMPGLQVDGNNAIEVYRATSYAMEYARSGKGPILLELLTYRVAPHSSSDDPSRYRDREESTLWLERDPLRVLEQQLEARGLWNAEVSAQVWSQARDWVNEATNQAEAKGEPAWETLFEDVYAQMPEALEREKQALLARESGWALHGEGEFPL
ncbi:MAG: thiamine pyrophosphate-dependent dehydrogenase E1 component subunit alpha [Candidatus Melainabacteria bacterium]|nr:thiamine pyrophosphate-dependent dehydrogenase E1 component subunit alpha [Candidatus Melainabacteria bacterium]